MCLLLIVGICLLTLLDGHFETSLCKFRYGLYVFVSVTFIVLGTFIFGLTTTQSLMKDFGYAPNSQAIVHDLSSRCLGNE